MYILSKPVYPLDSVYTPKLINKLEQRSSSIKTLVLWETLVMWGIFRNTECCAVVDISRNSRAYTGHF